MAKKTPPKPGRKPSNKTPAAKREDDLYSARQTLRRAKVKGNLTSEERGLLPKVENEYTKANLRNQKDRINTQRKKGKIDHDGYGWAGVKKGDSSRKGKGKKMLDDVEGMVNSDLAYESKKKGPGYKKGGRVKKTTKGKRK